MGAVAESPTGATRERALIGDDPTFDPTAAKDPFVRWALPLINDERDLPFVRLMFEISVVLVPFAIVLYALPSPPWWLGAAYLLVNALVFLDRFTLMLHNTSHRRLFNKDHARLNHLIPWFYGLFFGQSPMAYYVHHIAMHHPENNLPDDLSTTMPYKRDSFLGFMHYFWRFFLAGIIELSLYLKRKGRTKLLRKVLIGEFGFYAFLAVLLWLKPVATLWVFLLPFVIIRFLMMAGNWGQHAFIDPAAPEDPYLNSLTCINARYNRRAFNDGYHIGHHVKANRHWTEMPTDFLDDRANYADKDAIVLRGTDFFMVWFFLMLKQYGWLADRYVDVGNRGRSREEVIALLQSRTKPIRN